MSKDSICPFSTLRVRKCSIRPRAFSPSSSVTSRPTVSRPASTASCAMPAPIVPSPTTPTFTRRSLTGYELGTELLQRARECCPEALVPVRGGGHTHGTQGAMAVAARVRLGLRECPLPTSGGCRRYQCRLTLLPRPLGASGCGTRGRCGQLESRGWTCARAPLAFGEAETWYRVTGDLQPGDGAAPAPLVVLHGGPGATHDYLLSLTDLAGDGARSSTTTSSATAAARTTRTAAPSSGRPSSSCASCTTSSTRSGSRDRHHVLGQSWGGFLAQEYALTQPAGLRSLVLADTAASWADFVAEANKLRAELPRTCEATLASTRRRARRRPRVHGGVPRLLPRHVCRVPWPPEVAASVRVARERPDRLPHDERAERVPRHRLAARTGRSRTGCARSACRRCSSPAATTRPRRRCSRSCSTASPTRSGSASRSRHTCRTSRSASAYMQVVGDWLARHD